MNGTGCKKPPQNAGSDCQGDRQNNLAGGSRRIIRLVDRQHDSLEQLTADAKVCFQQAYFGEARVEFAGDILVLKARQMVTHGAEGRALVQSLYNACSHKALQEWASGSTSLDQNPWNSIADRLEEILK